MTRLIPLKDVYKIRETGILYYLSKEEFNPDDVIVAQDLGANVERRFDMQMVLSPVDGIRKGHFLYILSESEKPQTN